MSSITLNFKDGIERTTDQKHRLGIVVPDVDGNLWSYVQFREAVAFGQPVDDAASTLISGSGEGTVTTGAAIGTNLLVDSAEFGAAEDKWLVGAIGYLNDGTGAGQAFYVKRWVDNNTLEIELLMSTTAKVGGGGWATATDTTTKYGLWTPGLVVRATNLGLHRGVAQAAAKKGEYGFVQQTGWAAVSANGGGNALSRGRGLIPFGSGSTAGVQGWSAGTTDSAYNQSNLQTTIQNLRVDVYESLGVYGFNDIDASGASPIYVPIHINNRAISYRFSDDKHAINQVVIA